LLNTLPHHPHLGILKTQKDTLSNLKNVIDLWFHLFSEILGDDKLIDKLWNTLYLVLGDEGTPKTIVTTNLPEKNTQRVQRRKVLTGK
jgi:hypothetical protein